MKAYFLPCAVCGSFDAERLFPSFYKDLVLPMQFINICRQCGLVYRNPHIPDLCVNVQEEVDDRSAAGADIIERINRVARHLADHVALGEGDFYLDIGCGPGRLGEAVAARFPKAQIVLLEPSPKVAAEAKRRNPDAVVLPASLDEAKLPEGAFSLITACGVDYLFQDHRREIETIHRLLRDDGVFYIERNDFVDGAFGHNALMNTWFGRDQFKEYLGEFFEVFNVHESEAGVAAACRKHPGGERRRPASVPNRYGEHFDLLRARTLGVRTP